MEGFVEEREHEEICITYLLVRLITLQLYKDMAI